MRLRATIIVEYEANPADYGDVTGPAEMVRIDVEEGDIASVFSVADSVTLKGEEVADA